MANILFNEISINGRIAYTILCAEKYALAKYPDKDWKPLFKWMWTATSDYLDEWYYRFMEILPENLLEFSDYQSSDFEYLSEEDYRFYSGFMKDLDDNMINLITIPGKIAMEYCYSSIPGIGKETIGYINEAITILNNNNIELPSIETVTFSSFKDKDGWGNHFDGTVLSCIL